MNQMFYNCPNLKAINISSFTISSSSTISIFNNILSYNGTIDISENFSSKINIEILKEKNWKGIKENIIN